jgi:SH3 domain protein
MRNVILILLLGFFVLPAGRALAATQYVSDQLTITLRRGEGDQYKILKMLKTGTPVEILQEGTAGHLFVRTSDGTEGWVQKQFLTTETPKPIVISRLEKERERLREQVKQLETRQVELTTELENARKDRAGGDAAFADLQKELDKVRAEYADLQTKAADVVELAAERDRLKVRSDQLSVEVDQLRQENENMLFTGAVKWFLAGGGVLLVGVMLGKTSRKKKGFSY